jgi:hypothetical protein
MLPEPPAVDAHHPLDGDLLSFRRGRLLVGNLALIRRRLILRGCHKGPRHRDSGSGKGCGKGVEAQREKEKQG